MECIYLVYQNSVVAGIFGLGFSFSPMFMILLQVKHSSLCLSERMRTQINSHVCGKGNTSQSWEREDQEVINLSLYSQMLVKYTGGWERSADVLVCMMMCVMVTNSALSRRGVISISE